MTKPAEKRGASRGSVGRWVLYECYEQAQDLLLEKP